MARCRRLHSAAWMPFDRHAARRVAPDAGAPARRMGRATSRTIAQRRDDLRRLRRAFAARVAAMDAAIRADFGHRSTHENLVSEAMVVLAEIDHALAPPAPLDEAAAGRRSAGASGRRARKCGRMPVGVVGIIAPWNYPVNLALVPLVSAIAAGNHVYLKPSEHTPRTSAVAARPAGRRVPGRPRRRCARAAPTWAPRSPRCRSTTCCSPARPRSGARCWPRRSPNLTPVTLELGGKSPALVAPDFPLDLAAARIASGKWFNAGQTCIGVDYVLVDARASRCVRRRACARSCARATATCRRRRLHAHHQRRRNSTRLAGLSRRRARRAARAVMQPIAIDPGRSRDERLFPPTLVLDPPRRRALMREEIFGPILPIRTLRDDRRRDRLRQRARPPARAVSLQPRRARRSSASRAARSPAASASTTRCCTSACTALPFGGIGPSGRGAIHGRAGFETFSKLLPVFRQSRWSRRPTACGRRTSARWTG